MGECQMVLSQPLLNSTFTPKCVCSLTFPSVNSHTVIWTKELHDFLYTIGIWEIMMIVKNLDKPNLLKLSHIYIKDRECKKV